MLVIKPLFQSIQYSFSLRIRPGGGICRYHVVIYPRGAQNIPDGKIRITIKQGRHCLPVFLNRAITDAKAVEKAVLVPHRCAVVSRQKRAFLDPGIKPRQNHTFTCRHLIFRKYIAIVRGKIACASKPFCSRAKERFRVNHTWPVTDRDDIKTVHIGTAEGVKHGGQSAKPFIKACSFRASRRYPLYRFFLESVILAADLLRHQSLAEEQLVELP